MAVMDGPVISLALSLIASDLGTSPSDIIWVVSAYQLAITISLFPLSALGERIGFKKVYCSGIALFTIASVVCAVSQSAGMIISARTVQGIGASGILSVNIALVRHIYPKNSFGSGIGYNTLIVGVSAAAGPTIASTILTAASWQWLFLLNVPLGITALAIGCWALPRTPLFPRPIDALGIVLSSAAISLLICATDGARRGDHQVVLFVQLLASLYLFFCLYQQQRSKIHPTIPVDLLRIPAVRISALTSVLSYVAQSLSYIGLPFFFHTTIGFSVLKVGLLMTTWPLALALASPWAGYLSDRISITVIGAFGLAALSLGLALIILLPDRQSALDIVWRMAICGVGFGLFQVSNSKAIVVGGPPNRIGAASALHSASRSFGQTLGAAALAALFGRVPNSAIEYTLYLALVCAVVACLTNLLRVRLR
jgi:DHA2 family multidrug resistance protein-like MFS transporter